MNYTYTIEVEEAPGRWMIYERSKTVEDAYNKAAEQRKRHSDPIRIARQHREVIFLDQTKGPA